MKTWCYLWMTRQLKAMFALTLWILAESDVLPDGDAALAWKC